VPTAEAEEADFFDNDPSVTEGGDLDDSAAVAALASSLLPPDEAARFQKPAAPSLRIKPPLPVAGTVRDLDAESANGATRRWRLLTVAFAAIAALLAIYVAVSQFMSGPSAAPFAGSASRGGRLVAVMQQDPTAPAFLVTIDGPARALTVRRVTATPDVGRSYQLWLMPRNGAPVSLGVVGNDEFTTRPIPPNVDNDTLRTANYVISLEQAGGSPTGAMTGPMLFSGHIIEAVPGPQSSN
jgi:anti-sigma-K factor RskA